MYAADGFREPEIFITNPLVLECSFNKVEIATEKFKHYKSPHGPF
jgi:hypothetical protein